MEVESDSVNGGIILSLISTLFMENGRKVGFLSLKNAKMILNFAEFCYYTGC